MPIPMRGIKTEKMIVGMPKIAAFAGEIRTASILFFLSPLIYCIIVKNNRKLVTPGCSQY